MIFAALLIASLPYNAKIRQIYLQSKQFSKYFKNN
jgi:hypothetical protein